jgi:hypothetical protein
MKFNKTVFKLPESKKQKNTKKQVIDQSTRDEFGSSVKGLATPNDFGKTKIEKLISKS